MYLLSIKKNRFLIKVGIKIEVSPKIKCKKRPNSKNLLIEQRSLLIDNSQPNKKPSKARSVSTYSF